MARHRLVQEERFVAIDIVLTDVRDGHIEYSRARGVQRTVAPLGARARFAEGFRAADLERRLRRETEQALDRRLQLAADAVEVIDHLLRLGKRHELLAAAHMAEERF